ncbi:hypothetical protein B0H16DRAFT_1893606 [Mycena metata]|uniref:Uncharacterized protein n=1 Tax=Mycena metata TaxID=1033252 RepID=A0AAD7MRX6_9AGAR|nr:hypothetical protein B0H16DRAFT_1893606 [Mycena metata]
MENIVKRAKDLLVVVLAGARRWVQGAKEKVDDAMKQLNTFLTSGLGIACAFVVVWNIICFYLNRQRPVGVWFEVPWAGSIAILAGILKYSHTHLSVGIAANASVTGVYVMIEWLGPFVLERIWK